MGYFASTSRGSGLADDLLARASLPGLFGQGYMARAIWPGLFGQGYLARASWLGLVD